MATEGTFVLADIGGYTGFLTGVGIEHGKEITSHLLNSLLKRNRGRWKLANIEGDCLFLYREGREPAEELLGHVRTLYEDFCDRTLDIAERASCPCGACSRTSELSLKFIVHAGQFDTQKIGDRVELIGPGVVVIHRLLKNSGAKMIHVNVGIDRENRRRTEKIWASRLLRDVYVTTEVRPLPNGRTQAGFLATYKPAIPVVSHVAVPVFKMVMKRQVGNDMAGLKEFCEVRAAVGS